MRIDFTRARPASATLAGGPGQKGSAAAPEMARTWSIAGARSTAGARFVAGAALSACRAVAACTALAVSAAALLSTAATADEVGRVGVDWVGNDIVIEAIPDPKVAGVTCHVAYFDRSLIDRLSKGNWFEDPSNGSIACRQTGPITLGDIAKGPKGEKVFSESRSLVFKSLRVTRVYDAENQVLIYLTHANELTDGSAKMAISTVPLYGSE